MLHKKIIQRISFGILLFPCFLFAKIEIVDDTVLKIPLDEYDIKVRVGDPTSNVLSEVGKLGGEAGINGSFFCPAEKAYSWCGADNSTASDRIIEGENVSTYPQDTGVRGIFGFTKNNEVLFVQNNLGYIPGYKNNTNSDKVGLLRNGIGNFPILVDKGKNPLSEYGDHIDDAKMTNKTKRAFICAPRESNVIYMGYTTDKNLRELPFYLIRKYDCYFALNLDAGASSALVYQGDHIVGPGRDVIDGYVAVPKESYLEEQFVQYTFSKRDQEYIKKQTQQIIQKIQNQTRTKSEILLHIQTLEQSSQLRADITKRSILRVLAENIKKL